MGGMLYFIDELGWFCYDCVDAKKGRRLQKLVASSRRLHFAKGLMWFRMGLMRLLLTNGRMDVTGQMHAQTWSGTALRFMWVVRVECSILVSMLRNRGTCDVESNE